MVRRSASFPTRVAVIALAIVVAVGLLVMAVNRLGRPSQEPAPATPENSGVGTAPDAGSRPAPEKATTATVPTRDEPVTVQLYLIDVGTHELVPRVRRLQAPPTIAAQARAALELLVRAGTVDYVSPLPPGTVIREVWVSKSGVAYVDLAAGFEDLLEQGSHSEIHAVYGMVGTLTSSFPEIERVQFLVGDQAVDTFTGHLDLSTPLGPLSDWLY